MKQLLISTIVFLNASIYAQNGIVGDGYGGRLWYSPTNFSVGSYTGFTVCNKEENNQLLGWGNNSNGELGVVPESMYGTTEPVEIPGMSNVKYYTTGYNMAAIKHDNSGWVWGFNNFNFAPTQVINDVKFVEATVGFVSFIKNDGTVWSIGDNSFGTYGDLTINSNYQNPVQMQGITTAVRVASSLITNYVLCEDKHVYVCGGDGTFNLGTVNGNLSASYAPVQMANLEQIIDIKANSMGILALDNTGSVFIQTFGFHNTAIQLQQLTNIVAISGMCDGGFFLALDANKNVYEIDYYGVSTLVATNAIDILAGETFSYIIKSDGTLWGKGMSNGGSIWLNLPDTPRSEYTFIDVNQVDEICPVLSNYPVVVDCKTIQMNMYQGNPPYQYSIGNGNQNNPVFTDLNPGNYAITVTEANGAISTYTIELESNYQNIEANFTSNPILSNNLVLNGSIVEFQSESTPESDLYWYVNNTQVSTNTVYEHLFSQDGVYCITLKAEKNHCTDTQTVCITASTEDIQFPNIFTPNNDGNNDNFTLNIIGAVEYKGVIVNRWGEVVAEIDNNSPHWDGIINGKLANEGVYFISVDYTLLDQDKKRYTGFFQLFE